MKILGLLLFASMLLFGCINRNFNNTAKMETVDALAVATVDAASQQSAWSETSTKLFSDKLHSVQIMMSQNNFQDLVSTCANPNAPWRHVRKLVIDETTFTNVAIKVRGNTSRCNQKMQFNIRLDKSKKVFTNHGKGPVEVQYSTEDANLIKAQNIFGINGFSLRASGNDDTMINEKLSSEVFQQGDALARTVDTGNSVYRVGYTKFFLSLDNNPQKDYKGLYIITENYGKEFIKQRFLGKLGTLIGTANAGYNKTASLLPNSFSPEAFSVVLHNGEEVDDDSTEEKEAHNLVKDFINKVNTAVTKEDFEAFIKIDSVLNYMAAVHFTGHWDSLFGNRNNDYLYFDAETNKWQIFTWDLDNSFQTFASSEVENASMFSTPSYAPCMHR